jgi:glycosyltransferase involved in cell wall biosynthesis
VKILFIHQNFPGQFKHLAPALAKDQGHEVAAMRMGVDAVWQGVQVFGYQVKTKTTSTHALLNDMHAKVLRAEAIAQRALELKQSGYTPDVIVAHPGWGETLFVKQVWPAARLGLYAEFFYSQVGADVGFDPEFPSAQDPLANACRLRMKNANQLLAFDEAQRCISPTQWQKSTYPEKWAAQIDVIHDGIDTELLRPNPAVAMQLNGQKTLTRQDEIITFVNRNLEPYRGYHQFVRALPELLRKRPDARVMIVGGKDVSYGALPPKGRTWREIFWNEVKDQVDVSRVHFLGHMPYPDFVKLLQLSAVHVYLTYPFVLSWSLLEAMSVQCAIVASRTAPVLDVLEHEHSALLVDFFQPSELVQAVCRLLEDQHLAARLGLAARAHAVEHFDLRTVCLPQQMKWVHALAQISN